MLVNGDGDIHPFSKNHLVCCWIIEQTAQRELAKNLAVYNIKYSRSKVKLKL